MAERAVVAVLGHCCDNRVAFLHACVPGLRVTADEHFWHALVVVHGGVFKEERGVLDGRGDFVCARDGSAREEREGSPCIRVTHPDVPPGVRFVAPARAGAEWKADWGLVPDATHVVFCSTALEWSADALFGGGGSGGGRTPDFDCLFPECHWLANFVQHGDYARDARELAALNAEWDAVAQQSVQRLHALRIARASPLVVKTCVLLPGAPDLLAAFC
jgi:hypothetical protein